MSEIAKTYSGSMDCLRRAITAALRYAGREDDTSWIPAGPPIEILEQIVERYGLEWRGRDGPETFDAGDRPVVVLYDTGLTNELGPVHHAVFCSDIAPARHLKISHVLLGWERQGAI